MTCDVLQRKIDNLESAKSRPLESIFIYHKTGNQAINTNLQLVILGNSCSLWVIEPLDAVMSTKSFLGFFRNL